MGFPPYIFCIKRDVYTWGIGRELYSAPFIWIPATETEIYRRNEKEERYYCNEHFSVSSITYNDAREISTHTITDGKGRTVFDWKKKSGSPEAPAKKAKTLTKKQMATLEAELQRTGVGMDAVKERYSVEKPEQMSAALYERVMNALAKTKSADAA